MTLHLTKPPILSQFHFNKGQKAASDHVLSEELELKMLGVLCK